MTKSSLAAVFVGVLILVAIVVVIVSRQRPGSTARTAQPPAAEHGLRYLPLGDSYTIGESVDEAARWPNQLVARLNANKITTFIVANPSVTGYTSQNLIDQELPLVARLKPDFVTVLIGVNDYVQGVSIETFQKNLIYILDVLQKEMAAPSHIVLVTIPDYGKTPTGAHYGAPAESEAAIKKFNQIIAQQASQRGLPLADIFPASQDVVRDSSLIAPDGLHPSGKQYAAWTEVIYPLSYGLLQTNRP